MGVTKFDIIFDQPDKVYYPGQMVTGRVELVTNSIQKIRGVELKIKGRAKCKWEESENYTDNEGKSHTRYVTHQEKEVYLKSEIKLVGGKEKFELPTGEHIYPFAAMLPNRAPSSFNGSYGGIGYYAKAKIDIPLAIDKNERQTFTVVNLLNLNNFPSLRTPSKNEKTKTFCCWCCASGPLTIAVHLPKTGFAKSESIPITLEVDNASNVGVSAVHCYLKRNIDWRAQGEHKYENLQLQKLRFGAVEGGQSHTWSENLAIPPTDFPFLDDCSIIKLSYELHIEADASGMHSDLDMHIPLSIGDIPLNEDPNAPIVNPYPQPQAYPNNVPYNPGMVNSVPYGVPAGIPINPQMPGYPGVPPGVPHLQICPQAPPGYQPGIPNQAGPPNLGFVQPNLYPGAMPQYPNPEYPPNYNPSATYVPPVQPANNPTQYPPPSYNPSNPVNSFTPPPQPATNPECAQNTPYPPVASSDGLADENAKEFTPLLPSCPSAPPPS